SPSVGTDFVQNLRPLSTAGSHFPGVASMLAGIAVEFWLFALTLLGIALTHRYTLQVALAGLAVIVAYKLFWAGFAEGAGLAGFALHFEHESVTLVNLLGLLIAFAVIARWFEDSGLPLVLPKFLPDDWTGAF